MKSCNCSPPLTHFHRSGNDVGRGLFVVVKVLNGDGEGRAKCDPREFWPALGNFHFERGRLRRWRHPTALHAGIGKDSRLLFSERNDYWS